MGAKMIIEDPTYVREKTVDGNGRLYLGKEFAETDVRVVIDVLDEDENESS